MAITGASTVAEIRAAYLDNLGYDAGAGSVSMCQAFIAACRALLLVLPAAHAQDRSSSQFSPQLIEGQLKAAQNWLGQRSDAGGGQAGVMHFDMCNLRD